MQFLYFISLFFNADESDNKCIVFFFFFLILISTYYKQNIFSKEETMEISIWLLSFTHFSSFLLHFQLTGDFLYFRINFPSVYVFESFS